MESPEYTEGIAGDGAAILKDGVQMTVTEILQTLNQFQSIVDKWNDLDEKIGKYYEEEDIDESELDEFEGEGSLLEIGETAAIAFGYL